jgi:hypothetical protein
MSLVSNVVVSKTWNTYTHPSRPTYATWTACIGTATAAATAST